MLIKYSSGSFPAVADKISKVYKHYEPDASLYQPRLYLDLAAISELTVPSNLIGLAFIIALSLACMGLFGLASFTSEIRTKEIGIRKANGATTPSIVRLLLTNYTKWLTIAFFIALPVAFFIGKFLPRKFQFPRTNAAMGFPGRSNNSFCDSAINRWLTNMESCKPKPSEVAEVRVVLIHPKPLKGLKKTQQ